MIQLKSTLPLTLLSKYACDQIGIEYQSLTLFLINEKTDQNTPVYQYDSDMGLDALYGDVCYAREWSSGRLDYWH